MDEQFDDRVTVVMITMDRAAEADRTLGLLEELPEHPRIIVVDNGSKGPLDPALASRVGSAVRIERLDPAPPSPVRAANHESPSSPTRTRSRCSFPSGLRDIACSAVAITSGRQRAA